MTVRTLQTQDEAEEVSIFIQDSPAFVQSPHPRLNGSFYTTQRTEQELGIRRVEQHIDRLLTLSNELIDILTTLVPIFHNLNFPCLSPSIISYFLNRIFI